jgi:cob(I)alamin adenosyltransferase
VSSAELVELARSPKVEIADDDSAPARKGFVQVYTGEGKGKTTAAIGLSLRASGHGRRVFIGQFMKGRRTGEVRAFQDSTLVDIEQFGDLGLWERGLLSPVQVARARRGLARAREAVRSGEYDVVVLDEVDVAVWFGLLTEGECLALIDERPEHVELVFTGRWAPRALIDRADLVTEMREVKHYYRTGTMARAGIEY